MHAWGRTYIVAAQDANNATHTVQLHEYTLLQVLPGERSVSAGPLVHEVG